MKKRKNIEQIATEIEEKAGPILTIKRLIDLTRIVAEENPLSPLLDKTKIFQQVKKRYIRLPEWEFLIFPKIEFLTKTMSIDIFFLSTAFSYNHTYSHFSALYLNGLINQRPSDVFLTKYSLIDRKTKDKFNNVDQDYLKILFRKSPKVTTKHLQFMKNEIFFIEKERRELQFTDTFNYEHEGFNQELKITNKYKTIIDSVISPQYSGGVTTIIQAFEGFPDMDLEVLAHTYNEINPVYPYWQCIGLYLEKVLGEEISNEWLRHFEVGPQEFYLTKGYEDNWLKSEKWNLYYPDVFNEN